MTPPCIAPGAVPIRRIRERSGAAGSSASAPDAPLALRAVRLRRQRESTVDRARGIAAIAMVLATIFQSPKAFLYDASVYWASSVDVASGVDPYDDGLLRLRGAWTAVLYVPAAVVERLSGANSSGFAVLLENALIIACLGAVLIPQLVRVWRPVTPPIVYASAAATWLVLARFAPYPLSDVVAAAFFLGAVVLLTYRSDVTLAVAGLLAGIGLNVRPAYLLPAIAIAGAVAVYRRRNGLWFLVGAAAALVPQTITNVDHGASWTPWPPGTSGLTALQSAYAAFVVRYDTAAYGPATAPQLFFCNPRAARDLGAGSMPGSPSELVSFYAHHPLDAALLISEKVGASLHWPISVPYYSPAGIANPLFALLVTAIAVAGASALAVLLWIGRPTLPQVAIVVLWVGSLATIATSTPETRFALPLVVLGIVGCAAMLAGNRQSWGVGRGAWTLPIAVVATVLVFSIGQIGLRHPASPGDVTPQVCSRT